MQILNIVLIVLVGIALIPLAYIAWRSWTATGGGGEIQERLGESAGRIRELENQLERVTAERDAAQQDKLTLAAQLETHRERSESQAKALKEMNQQFATTANKVLGENKQQLSDDFKLREAAINKIVEPLKKEIGGFRQRMETIHTESVKSDTTLQARIEQLQLQERKYGESADNLANTLKGDSKIQGDWGEVALAKLLEDSGLREGYEYKTQDAVQGEEGEWLRPDVVIYLPDDKHLILDSKVSLRAYYEFVNHDDQDARERHLKAVREHVKALASKHYHAASKLTAPDFVFMFLPIEPAFLLAMRDDPELAKYAHDKGVALCTPTTLMTILRTVERIWRVERRNREAEEIARLATSLHDKIAGFEENMKKVDKALSSAQVAYDLAYKQLITGKGSAGSIVRKFTALGISSSKTISGEEIGSAPPPEQLEEPLRSAMLAAADDDEA